METFGFSAFLKLISLSERQRASELARRLARISRGGYDFHRKFRLLARTLVVERGALSDVLADAEGITKEAERKSTVAALQRLALWRKGMPVPAFSSEQVIYKSPRGGFRLRFDPNFQLTVRGSSVAFHVWNTKTPALSPGGTLAALSLVATAAETQGSATDDFAVLSVREPVSVYRLSEAPDVSLLAERLAAHLDTAILGPLTPPGAEDRPAR